MDALHALQRTKNGYHSCIQLRHNGRIYVDRYAIDDSTGWYIHPSTP